MKPVLESDSGVIMTFGATGVRPQTVQNVVKDLPIYADRQYILDGMSGFLRGLPLMAKSDLRRHFPQGFLRPGQTFATLMASKKAEVVRTSGTSSDRLQLLWETNWWERQELAALRGHPVLNPHLNEQYREVVLTTPLCSESVCKTGPATMEERQVDNLLFLNTQHDPSRWTPADLSRMADEIERFQPVAMEADPVYLAALARYIRDSHRPVPRLQWIILTYEFVSAIHKSAIQSLFGCPVFEFYGLTEAGVFFLECPRGRHHFCGTDSIVEILRGHFALPANMGEVIVTAWGNTAAPLLRYQTGDLVTVEDADCSCGLTGPTIRCFEGRIRDMLEFPDGRIFTPRHIDGVLAGAKGLAQYVCIQERPDAVRVDYVQDGSDDPGPDIHSRLRALWKKIQITVKRVPFIPPEQSGKYRTVTPL